MGLEEEELLPQYGASKNQMGSAALEHGDPGIQKGLAQQDLEPLWPAQSQTGWIAMAAAGARLQSCFCLCQLISLSFPVNVDSELIWYLYSHFALMAA